MGASTDDS